MKENPYEIATFKTKVDTYEGKEVYRFAVSDNRINRNYWQTITAGIDTKEYMRNPVVLANHNMDEPPIGKALKVFSEKDTLYADIWFHEVTDQSCVYKKLVDLGVYSMTSIWVKPTKTGTPIPIKPEEKSKYPSYMETIPVYEESELREISIVGIPANTGAQFVEKIRAAINDNYFTEQELVCLKASIPDAIPEIKIINSPQTQESLMTLEEVQSKNIELQTNLSVKDRELIDLKAGADDLKRKLAEINQQALEAKTKIDEMTANENKLKAALEDANKLVSSQKAAIVEANVAADIASLSEYILPAENSADNNFKLKRDLTHLKLNEDTMKDADGKSLYVARIEEIKARKSNVYLMQPIDAQAKPTTSPIDVSKLSYATANLEERQAMAAAATELMTKEKITFVEAMRKITNMQEGE